MKLLSSSSFIPPHMCQVSKSRPKCPVKIRRVWHLLIPDTRSVSGLDLGGLPASRILSTRRFLEAPSRASFHASERLAVNRAFFGARYGGRVHYSVWALRSSSVYSPLHSHCPSVLGCWSCTGCFSTASKWFIWKSLIVIRSLIAVPAYPPPPDPAYGYYRPDTSPLNPGDFCSTEPTPSDGDSSNSARLIRYNPRIG